MQCGWQQWRGLYRYLPFVLYFLRLLASSLNVNQVFHLLFKTCFKQPSTSSYVTNYAFQSRELFRNTIIFLWNFYLLLKMAQFLLLRSSKHYRRSYCPYLANWFTVSVAHTPDFILLYSWIFSENHLGDLLRNTSEVWFSSADGRIAKSWSEETLNTEWNTEEGWMRSSTSSRRSLFISHIGGIRKQSWRVSGMLWQKLDRCASVLLSCRRGSGMHLGPEPTPVGVNGTGLPALGLKLLKRGSSAQIARRGGEWDNVAAVSGGCFPPLWFWQEHSVWGPWKFNFSF